MCLIFISVDNHPRYQLILAGNRDEFHSRPTAPATFWKDAPEVLAGRDLLANGTWLGVTRQGRLSLITNYRDPKNINPSAPSRGHLVSDFLISADHGKKYLDKVSTFGAKYNGFNLVVGTPSELWYYSNYGKGVEAVKPGLHGLSNALLDTPWPKVETGKLLLKPLLEKDVINPSEVFDVLYNCKRANDSLLPDTGVGVEWERALSSMFIKSQNYGSRCSTVLLVDRKGHVRFSERVYDLATFSYADGDFEFDIQSK